jgi:ankyrin repeat protein
VPRDRPILYALFGLNRAGSILWGFLFVAGFAVFVGRTFLPALRFSEADERLFRAARHGDRAGVEQALASGAGVNDPSPLDGRTALFRAAAFGHPDVVRTLLEHGADPAYRSGDSRTALEVVIDARREEKDAAAARALDEAAAALRQSEDRK